MDSARIIQQVRRRIINQDEALDQLEEALLIAEAGLNDPRKPLGVLLFVGPTGVGKTETVRALAEAIHGSADAYCRIDMSGLSESHYAASLAGSPPGYVGSQEDETLFNRAKIEGEPGKPGILLLDEIEKAHASVHQSLLQVFDNAHLRLANGKTEISFTNTLIVMTSNVGSDELRNLAENRRLGFQAHTGTQIDPRNERNRVVERALSRQFKPEFLNRIDSVVVFQWLGHDDLRRILHGLIGDLNQRLVENHGLTLELTPEAADFLIERGWDPKYGARPLKRALRRELYQPLARSLLSRSWPAGEKLVAERVDGIVRFRLAAPPPSLTVTAPPRAISAWNNAETSSCRVRSADRFG
ncbi:MAG TPA: AAA family ATPase [Chloroflexota bacterium]|nr:AAA family ATPase [Chloroflexota bacterium]